MSDLVYNVLVQYNSVGRLDSGLDRARHSADSWLKGLSRGVENLSGRFNDKFDSIAKSAASKMFEAATYASAAVAVGMGKAVHEAIRFNEEMETAAIGMAAVFGAHDIGLQMGFDGKLVDPLVSGFRLAQQSVAQMRIDARELPGEFKDLQNIMATVAPTGEAAGLDATGLEILSKKAMVAGAIHGIAQPVVARELAMVMAGTARHTMPLVNRVLNIGDTKSFNALDPTERFKKVSTELDKIYKSSDLIKGSWMAVRTTAVDFIRQGLGFTGYALFDRIKNTVAAFNKSAGSGRFVDLGVSVSNALVAGFDWAFDHSKGFFASWYPAIKDFATVMYNGFANVFTAISPIIKEALGSVYNFMRDPGAFEKIAHAAKLAVAVRAGTGALHSGAGTAGTLGNFLVGLRGMESLGVGMGEVAAAAPWAAGAMAVLATAGYGAAHALTDSQSAFHATAVQQAGAVARNIQEIGKEADKLGQTMTPFADFLGTWAITALRGWTFAIEEGISAVNGIVMGFDTLRGLFGAGNPGVGDPTEEILRAAHEATVDHALNTSYKFIKEMNADNNDYGGSKADPPKHTTHIHNVNIHVQGDPDPDRVAKTVFTKLMDVRRHPITSPHDPRGGRSF